MRTLPFQLRRRDRYSHGVPDPPVRATSLVGRAEELAELVREVIGYKGPVYWDNAKPDGMPRKLLS